MTPLTDILRALHLVVEEVVIAEESASAGYAEELYTRILTQRLPFIQKTVAERKVRVQ